MQDQSRIEKIIMFSIIPLIVAVLFIMSLYQYNVPTRDDYAYGARFIFHPDFIDLLFANLKAGGRLVSNFLYGFVFVNGVDFTEYRVLTFSLLLLFIFISFLNISKFLKNYSRLKIVTVAVLLIATWMFSLRSIRDALFWLGGAINYLLPLTTALFLIYLLYKIYHANSKAVSTFLSVMFLILVFLIPLGTEVLGLSLLWLAVAGSIITTVNKKYSKLRFIFYCSIVLIFVSLLTSYLSPSTVVRADSSDGGRFFRAVWVSLMSNFERTFETYVVSMIIPASVLIYLLLKPREYLILIPKLSVKLNITLIYLIAFIATWAAQFTISFAMNFSGLPDRAKMIPQTIAVIFYIIGNVYVLKALEIDKKIKNLTRFTIVIILVMYLMVFTSREFAESLYNIGNFKNYAEAIEQRHTYLETMRGHKGDIIFDKIDSQPLPVTDYYLSSDCASLSNGCIAYYFQIDGCVRLKEGADGDKVNSGNVRIVKLRRMFD